MILGTYRDLDAQAAALQTAVAALAAAPTAARLATARPAPLGKLLSAWLPTGGGFATALGKAGPASSVYPKQKQVVQELLDGMIGSADEVANSKIEQPLAQQNTDFEEARYSQNSKAELLQNLAGIEAIYTGRLGSSSGAGFSKLVVKSRPALDVRASGRSWRRRRRPSAACPAGSMKPFSRTPLPGGRRRLRSAPCSAPCKPTCSRW